MECEAAQANKPSGGQLAKADRIASSFMLTGEQRNLGDVVLVGLFTSLFLLFLFSSTKLYN